MGVIYTATFPNGFKYVGQTSCTLKQRISQHKSDYKKRNKEKKIPFYNAIEKYGFENLQWDIIDEYENKDDGNNKEIYWINKLRTYIHFSDCKGYNATLGGSSRAILNRVDESDLKEIGEKYFKGVDKKSISLEYNIPMWTIDAIYAGRQWSDFTHIPQIPDYKPHGSIYNEEEIDFILKTFKTEGNLTHTANIFKEKYNKGSARSIADILKGKTWSGYTGFINDDFYKKYLREDSKEKSHTKSHCKITPDIAIQIVQMKNNELTNKEISEKLNISITIVYHVLSGKTWNDITNIKK